MKSAWINLFLVLVMTLTSNSLYSEEIPPAKNNPSNQQRDIAMTFTPPSASRPAPPIVAPIEYKGIRYEQDSQSGKFGGAASTGYLVAIDPATNSRLWMLQVYAPFPKALNAPTGGGSIYFGKMELGLNEDELIIETEFGTRYLVNLTTRTSTQIFKPEERQRPHVNETLDVPDFLPLPNASK